MKQLTCLLFLSVIASAASAQSLSIGARAGADFWMVQEKGRSFFNSGVNGENTSFMPSLFLRYETKKHVAWEFSLNNSKTSFNTSWIWDGTSEWGPIKYATETTKTNYQLSNTSLTASVQYDMKRLFGCAHKCGLKNYMGFMLSPTFIRQNETSVVTYSDNSPGSSEQRQYHYFEIWLGISNTMSYPISNDIDITSAVIFQTSAANLLGDQDSYTKHQRYNADTRFSAQLGIAYKLN